MQPSPPGIRVSARGRAVELAIARPGRVRRALVLAVVTGAAFTVTAVAMATGTRPAKEPLFVTATLLLAAFGGAIRALVLGRRPLRLRVDDEHVLVSNARPWSMQNVWLRWDALTRIEPLPNGVAARLRDGRLLPIVRDLASDEVAFVEAVLHSAAARAASSTTATGASARDAERSFASKT